MFSEKNDLAICELIHPAIHGTDMENSGHYLVTWFIKCSEFYGDFPTACLLPDADSDVISTQMPHPFIRAYWDIGQKNGYCSLQIVEGCELDSGEYVGILKTFWLRIFQRKWRNICRERAEARKKVKFLRYREINGYFPL